MTKIEKDTRFMTSDGKIYRVLNVMFDDKHKTDKEQSYPTAFLSASLHLLKVILAYAIVASFG
jgi:hypothetical protein